MPPGIAAHDPGRLQEVIDAATYALEAELGPGAIDGAIRADVHSARSARREKKPASCQTRVSSFATR